MITRITRIQLISFIVLAALSVSFVGAKYAGITSLFVSTAYPVTLQLDESGGIFRNAEVTYQGVRIGRVGELRPTASGVQVRLLIDREFENIPADGLKAEVKSLSVVGELYVNLIPTSTSGPYLRDGSVIRAGQTKTPVPPAELLTSLNDLFESVPRDSLRTVVRETDLAFAGTGSDLGKLLESTSDLVDAADATLSETTRLIDDGATVLRTQNELAGDTASFSRDLRIFTAQLKESDPDLRRLVTTAPQLATQVTALLRESGTNLGVLLADLLTIGRLAEPRNAALRQVLITYPALSRAAYSAVPDDGTVHFGLVVNVDDPLPCTKGYESTLRRSGTEVTDIPVNTKATCALPRGNPSTVRGSQNSPREKIPSAATPGD